MNHFSIKNNYFKKGCCVSKRVSNNDKQKKKQNRIEYANSDIKIFPNEEKSQKIIVKEEEQVKLPKDEEVCSKCFYTNGKMYYCISIHKIKYVFDKK